MNSHKIPEVAGVILAGGRSSRFGSNKALAEINGKPLIRHVADTLEMLFDETLLITNTPEAYTFLKWRTEADHFKGAGPLAGIHAALANIKSSSAFVVGCDMPNLQEDLIRHLCMTRGTRDAIIPRHSKGMEPLHAVYDKSALSVLEQSLLADERKVGMVLHKLHVHWVDEKELLAVVQDLNVFHNVNRPDDLQQKRTG